MKALSIAQEQEHIRNIQSQNSQSAQSLQALIRNYHPLILALARKATPSSLLDDLYQEGVIGLIEAIHSFDITRSTKLSTFSYYRIRGRIKDYICVEAKYLPTDCNDGAICDEDDYFVEYSTQETRKYIDLEQISEIEINAEMSIMSRYLQQLSERQRRAILLSYWQDLDP